MATNDSICNGPITKQHLELILQKYFKTDTKLSNAEGVIISDGLGFTSDVMRVTLEWEVKNGLPVTVIAKAPKMESIAKWNENFGGDMGKEALDASANLVPIIHENECNVYECLKDEQPIPIAKIYGFWHIAKEHPGMIVMEDLGDRAMIIDSLAKGININQWRSIVENLADFNAWSLTTEIPWKEKLAHSNSSMAEICFRSFSKMADSCLKASMAKYPEYFGHVDEEKVLQHMKFDVLMEKHSLYQKFMPDVLQHCDFWINNFMFEKNPDGTIGDKIAAFIDFQLCLRGSGISDLAKVQWFCLNHEIRRANEMKMLRIYYDRFKSKAGDKLTASFEQIEYLYREALSLHGLFGTFTADYVLQKVANADKDLTGWVKKEFLSRMKAGYDDSAKYFGWTNSKHEAETQSLNKIERNRLL